MGGAPSFPAALTPSGPLTGQYQVNATGLSQASNAVSTDRPLFALTMSVVNGVIQSVVDTDSGTELIAADVVEGLPLAANRGFGPSFFNVNITVPPSLAAVLSQDFNDSSTTANIRYGAGNAHQLVLGIYTATGIYFGGSQVAIDAREAARGGRRNGESEPSRVSIQTIQTTEERETSRDIGVAVTVLVVVVAAVVIGGAALGFRVVRQTPPQDSEASARPRHA
jgi:hypothetical protein